eukprot:SAG22_NODE_129_length_18679_cov_40.656028_18_plen_296_part_00
MAADRARVLLESIQTEAEAAAESPDVAEQSGAWRRRNSEEGPVEPVLNTWTGCTVWKAGRALSRYLQALPEHVWRGTRCIELGCGCGLVGLTAAALGAEAVVLTDLVMHVAQHNRDRFFPEPADRRRVRLAELRWGDREAAAAAVAAAAAGTGGAGTGGGAGQFPDLILGADILYHRPAYDVLADTLDLLCGANTLVLLCSPDGRNPDEDQFYSALRRRGFHCQRIIYQFGLVPHYHEHYKDELPTLTRWMACPRLMGPDLAQIGFASSLWAAGLDQAAASGDVHLSFLMKGGGG